MVKPIMATVVQGADCVLVTRSPMFGSPKFAHPKSAIAIIWAWPVPVLQRLDCVSVMTNVHIHDRGVYPCLQTVFLWQNELIVVLCMYIYGCLLNQASLPFILTCSF